MRKRIASFVLIAMAAYAAMGASCDGNRVVTLTGQTGLAVAQSVDEVRKATTALVDQKALTPEQGIAVLERLKAVNAALEPLPGILRLIDVNNPDLSLVDKALVILENVSQDMSVVIAGVPISGSAQQLVDLIRAAQKTITTTLVEIAKLKESA
jgi:hypothetical protein